MDRVAICCRADTETEPFTWAGNLESPINLPLPTPLDCGRKPENPRRHRQNMQTLCGDSANNHTPELHQKSYVGNINVLGALSEL